MTAVPGHGHPSIYRWHSFNRDIAGSVKCHPEKQTSSQWTVETLTVCAWIVPISDTTIYRIS